MLNMSNARAKIAKHLRSTSVIIDDVDDISKALSRTTICERRKVIHRCSESSGGLIDSDSTYERFMM